MMESFLFMWQGYPITGEIVIETIDYGREALRTYIYRYRGRMLRFNYALWAKHPIVFPLEHHALWTRSRDDLYEDLCKFIGGKKLRRQFRTYIKERRKNGYV